MIVPAVFRLVSILLLWIIAESALVRIPIVNFTVPETKLTKLSANSTIRSAFLLTTTDSHFSVLYDAQLKRTSHYAECEYAANGGPFQRNGMPVGVVIANGSYAADDYLSGNIGFGKGPTEWVIGNVDTVKNIQEFVTGFDWLVYNGTTKVGNDTTGALRAPRTAIGLDRQGRLFILIVDGCEFW